ncbi:MAG: Stk1 family PASTA domain-containing Ser/Thr kinase [Clostridiaceae bacterium]|nr:Stk1 family PASTA domain-containing Ser/Thr kinase [Clostridiaceae bacterium]
MADQILGNRYQLLERIGGGGMAVVYKAKCLLLNRFVAVKILRSEFTDDEEFVKRFRVEAQAAASLNHPNIVSIYDVGKQDDTHYIVMEFIDGITLKEYISNRGVLPWNEAINIGIQICSAIEQAHKNFIVHRDIKPHNILITKEGIAKVTDFGIARAVTSATITMVGSTIGSVHYFSPEQARGGFTDEKSDLYSLGITLYEMVTGKVPFDGESPVAIALKHIQEKPEKPAVINPSIPKGVNDLILKAMKKDQNLRYQNASDMLSDLQRTLAEPNAKINGSNAVEELPTRKMQAVGADLEIQDKSDDGDEAYMEEEDTSTKKKRDRLSTWLGIATGLVITGLIVFIGIKLVIPAFIPEPIEAYIVEDYKNRKFEDVKALLSQHSIIAEDDRVYNDSVDKDIIIAQDIAVGNSLKPGSVINFTVSDGPLLVEIPDISGDESRVAAQIIVNSGLVPEEIREHNETVGKGLVIRTEPSAYEMVKPDTKVKVIVSLGPELEMVKMADLSGLTRTEAENWILKNKLKIGKILPEDVVSEVARVIKQYPLADSEVPEDTAVELTFGVEEQPPEDPGTYHPVEDPEGQEDDQPPVSSAKTKLITITLDPSRTYGEEVWVYVESTPSDTNIRKVEVNQPVARDRFPFSIQVTIGEVGTTHIIVYLDNKLALEQDIQ